MLPAMQEKQLRLTSFMVEVVYARAAAASCTLCRMAGRLCLCLTAESPMCTEGDPGAARVLPGAIRAPPRRAQAGRAGGRQAAHAALQRRQGLAWCLLPTPHHAIPLPARPHILRAKE